MKQELKRIENALHQLADPSYATAGAGSANAGSAVQPPSEQKITLPSFGKALLVNTGVTGTVAHETMVHETVVPDTAAKVTLPPTERSPSDGSAGAATGMPPAASKPLSKTPSATPANSLMAELVQAGLAHSTQPKTPTLPRVQSPGFTSHRNAANPALAINLFKDMEKIVLGWQEELHQVLRQIQDLYLQGPIVDGWLESYTQPTEGEASTFRHGEVECLMDYVEKEWGIDYAVASQAAAVGEKQLELAGYRLCGLNEDGQLWFRHCPPEQVGAVSLAIVRYQKLHTLNARRQYLETRLSQLAETLIGLHSQMTQD